MDDMIHRTLSEDVMRKVNRSRQDVYIGVPAKVVSTKDYTNLQCLDVRPVINDIHEEKDNTILQSVVIKKVFVSLPRSGNFSVEFPVDVGDMVFLHYSHRDISTFLDSDGSRNVDINVTKTAELEDCWITLDGGTRRNNLKPSTTDLVIKGPNTNININPAGDVTINTSGNSYLKSSAHTIDTDTTITGSLTVDGPTSLNNTLDVMGVTNIQSPLNALAGTFSSTYAGIGGAGAVFNVDMTITGGTVTIDGVVVNTHTHLDAENRPTGPMQ